jgi:hypothetical protein
MKTKIYRAGLGAFDIVTHSGRLFQAVRLSSGRWAVKYCGLINSAWRPSGSLIKGLPAFLRPVFFSILKTAQNG